jgi:hypothetical protein
VPQLEDSSGPIDRDEVHERWLAMQMAFAEYMRASELFENSQELTCDLAGQRSESTLLDHRRDAFERYLEARMEFLEGRFDEGYRREAAMASRPTRAMGGLRTVSRLAYPKWLIPLVAAGILSATVFSFAREQKHVRDLELARDQLRAGLSGTRDELRLLSEKLDARASTERLAVCQIEPAAQPPAHASQVAVRKPSGGERWRRLPEQTTTGRSVAARSYFALSRSSQFKRVGPIEVSLKSVDVRGNSVDVSIVSEPGKVNVQHLKLNQAVRIKGHRGRPLELVVDRITERGLSGHLIEFTG